MSTFLGLDAIHEKRFEHIKVAAVGHPDRIDQVQDIITVGEFYEIAAGGAVVLT